jgi:outer membrane lipoprotein SlyB
MFGRSSSMQAGEKRRLHNDAKKGAGHMKTAKILIGLVGASLVATPVLAETTLGPKDRVRVARAAPGERDDVRYCLIQRKKGAKKGTIIGAAGGAGTAVIAGGNVGETLLAAGAGALAGNLIGKGSGTNRACDDVLRRNR